MNLTRYLQHYSKIADFNDVSKSLLDVAPIIRPFLQPLFHQPHQGVTMGLLLFYNYSYSVVKEFWKVLEMGLDSTQAYF